MSMMKGTLELDFVVKGYPGSGRRVESESDLSRVYRPDLLQGAFMGDASLKIEDIDFSARLGWVTLIDWCIRLAGALTRLERETTCVLGFSESDDFLPFRREGGTVFVASSCRAGIAAVPHDVLAAGVRAFIDDRMRWIEREWPGAMRNSATEEGPLLGRPDRGRPGSG